MIRLHLIIPILLLNLIRPYVLLKAQEESPNTYGQILMMNRMDESRIKTLRLDKSLTIKMLDGRKMEGICSVKDEITLICGSENIRIDSIFFINGFVVRKSKEKAYGVGLALLSAAAAIYPFYLVIGGLGLGEGKALFVGVTLLFFDLILVYAAASLTGIYPRRFNTMNWAIRIEPPEQNLLLIPGETSVFQ